MVSELDITNFTSLTFTESVEFLFNNFDDPHLELIAIGPTSLKRVGINIFSNLKDLFIIELNFQSVITSSDCLKIPLSFFNRNRSNSILNNGEKYKT